MTTEDSTVALVRDRPLRPGPAPSAEPKADLARPYDRRRLRARDGVILEYSVAAAGPDAPWAALVMPFAAPLSLAEPFISALAQHNVITWESRLILDPRGASIEDDAFAMARHVADFDDLLRAHDIHGPAVVGYCSGAGVALAAVSQIAAKPRRLILVSGEYLLFGHDECATRISRELDSIFSIASANTAIAAAVWQKLAESMAANLSTAHPSLVLPYSRPDYFHRYALNYIAYRQTNFESLAAGVQTPTDVIAGACDEVTTVRASEHISGLIPGSKLFVEPNADHYELLRHGSSTLCRIRELLAPREDS